MDLSSFFVLGTKGQFEEISSERPDPKDSTSKSTFEEETENKSSTYIPEHYSTLNELRSLKKLEEQWISKNLKMEEKHCKLRKNYLMQKKEFYKQELQLLQSILKKLDK